MPAPIAPSPDISAASLPIGEAVSSRNPTTSFADVLTSASGGAAQSSTVKERESKADRFPRTEEKERRADRGEQTQSDGSPSPESTIPAEQTVETPIHTGDFAFLQSEGSIPAQDGEPDKFALSASDRLAGGCDQNSEASESTASPGASPAVSNFPMDGRNGLSASDRQQLTVDGSQAAPLSLGTKFPASDETQIVALEVPAPEKTQRAISEEKCQTAPQSQSQGLFDFPAVMEQIAIPPTVALYGLTESCGQAPELVRAVDGVKASAKPTVNQSSGQQPQATYGVNGSASAKGTADSQNTGSNNTAPSADHQQHGIQGQVSTGDQAQAVTSDAHPVVSGADSPSGNGQPAPVATHFQAPGGSKAASGSGGEPGLNGQSVPSSLAEAAPVHPAINTARLIQTMQDSELRVGIRSADFGNISISAAAVRDTLSAQISLEHSDLAKEITASLPEIRAAIGSSNLDVRVVSGGELAGNSNAGTNYSGHNGRQQGSHAETPVLTASDDAIAQEHTLPGESAILSAVTGLSRLDVRI